MLPGGVPVASPASSASFANGRRRAARLGAAETVSRCRRLVGKVTTHSEAASVLDAVLYSL
jgi:hypothetical protein